MASGETIEGHASARAAGRGGPVLSASGVSVRFGGVRAVDGVSLDVSEGEAVGLIGPNGAGKSSLLAALGGQQRTSTGSIVLDGRDITRLPVHGRARLGIGRTFQSTSEFQQMTVFENLVAAGRGATGASLSSVLWGWRSNRAEEVAAKARAWEILDRFEMSASADVYGRELSGGQRRLVEIMRCLMRRPRVLLLDEPMVGVAPHLVGSLVKDLQTISEEGIALVVVEHALGVIQELCSRVVVMTFGRVIADGPYDAVIADARVRDAYVG